MVSGLSSMLWSTSPPSVNEFDGSTEERKYFKKVTQCHKMKDVTKHGPKDAVYLTSKKKVKIGLFSK